MFENEEINVLTNKLNEFYFFTLQSIRHILNSTDVDKVTWCTASWENDPDSFANTLYSAGLTLFTKNHIFMGNFVLTGKRGFDILKKMGSPRFVFEGNSGTIDLKMIVHYIPSMDENRFIVSVYNLINFDKDSDYKVYYNKMYENIDDIVVGEIVDSEDSNKSNEIKSEMNDKCETVSANTIKWNSKTHLIFGKTGCGKTSMFRQLIQDKLNRNEDVLVLGTVRYGSLYFKDKNNNKLHFYSPKDMSGFSIESSPKELAEYIVNFYYSVADKDSTRTVAIDGLEYFTLNPDYATVEYFRELTKECNINGINFLYTLGIDSDDKEFHHRLPEIYERFSDIITVLK